MTSTKETLHPYARESPNFFLKSHVERCQNLEYSGCFLGRFLAAKQGVALAAVQELALELMEDDSAKVRSRTCCHIVKKSQRCCGHGFCLE